jgi:glutathione S-transferase
MTYVYRLHYAPDNASLIIRLALEEIGVPYQTVLVDRRVKAQKSPEYRQLNPAGLIPVLETPQGPIFETGAILLWLADTHGTLAPAPSDPNRGAFLKWLFFVANTLHADLRMTFYPAHYVGNAPDAQDALRNAVQSRLCLHLGLLDDLAAQSPAWLSPNAPSVLTPYIACLMRWMTLYPVDSDRSWFALSDTPHLQTLLIAYEQRPATHAAQRIEGLGPTPFTAPIHATPSEGSPT